MPSMEGVQFALQNQTGAQLVPETPITIPGGAYGTWPLRLDCHGILLRYAAAAPLCHVEDAAGMRLYAGKTLLLDQFYNGHPFSIALWRIPREAWPQLRLQMLPFSPALLPRLPKAAQARALQAQAAGTLGQITLRVTETVATVAKWNFADKCVPK